MIRSLALTALVASADAYSIVAPRASALSAFRPVSDVRVAVPVRPSRAVMMSYDPNSGSSEPVDKEAASAMAILGAFLGVYIFDNVLTAGILAGLCAYLTTTEGQVGEISKATGKSIFGAYKKVVDFAEEKKLIPQAKSITDKVVGAAKKVDANYGISSKIDEKLQVRARAREVAAGPCTHGRSPADWPRAEPRARPIPHTPPRADLGQGVLG